MRGEGRTKEHPELGEKEFFPLRKKNEKKKKEER